MRVNPSPDYQAIKRAKKRADPVERQKDPDNDSGSSSSMSTEYICICTLYWYREIMQKPKLYVKSMNF